MGTISFTKVSLPFGWLGNMSPHGVSWGGRQWRTAEALFQARRFASDDPIVAEIHSQASPMAAKMVAKRGAGRRVVVPQSAEDVALMAEVLRLKLQHHPDLARMLRATGESILVEDCTSRPRGSGLFWGAARQADGGWKGDNVLGRLWMDVRQVSKEAA